MERYEVGLWSGAGYSLTTSKVEASHEQEALEEAVELLIKDGGRGLLYHEVDEMSSHDIDEYEDDEMFLYLDLTERDLGCIYLCIENAYIKSLD